jgi:hypothetical protein
VAAVAERSAQTVSGKVFITSRVGWWTRAATLGTFRRVRPCLPPTVYRRGLLRSAVSFQGEERKD